MRKMYFFSILLFAPYLRADHCSCSVTSHTFFNPRLQFQVVSPELLSNWRGKQCLPENEECRFTMQAVILGGRSTKPAALGAYFMPFCSATAAATSTIADTNNELLVQNFNIPSIQFSPTMEAFLAIPPLTNPFSSIISISPRQSVIGLGLTGQYNFCLADTQWWFRLTGPIIQIRNNMHLREQVITNGLYSIPPVANSNLTDQQPNMTAALSQAQWLYGKIDSKTHKKTRLAFLQAQLGHVLLCHESSYLSPFVGINIPLGGHPKAEFIFEPTAGNGNHWGAFLGFTSEFLIFDDFCNFELGGAIDTEIEYLFKKTERRSFDIKNRPWSRYNELYASRDQANQVIAEFMAGTISELQAIFINSPGINLFTQKFKVKPGFNFTANFALTFLERCERGFDGEIGYNFYARQAECLSLKNKNFNAEQAAFKDAVGMGFTNQIRTITENRLTNEANVTNLLFNGEFDVAGAMSTYDRAIVQASDIDLASASHPCVISNTVYATAGYHWDDCCLPMIASLGLSYEFSRSSNAVLNRWLLWGRYGISW